ncbi:30S ribosomal protein S19 [Candidatus Pacearchaeota archaeon]|nr:30S ribosomal protein S19 [Candidatus Pacearchaeota archaeon]
MAEVLYRGKNIEELKKLEIREFAKLLPSRRRRSLLRQFAKIENFLMRTEKKIKRGKQIKTHARDFIIVPKVVGLSILVHNGKEFVPVNITAEMLGHRLGEFVATRKRVQHSAPGIGATRSSAALSVK